MVRMTSALLFAGLIATSPALGQSVIPRGEGMKILLQGEAERLWREFPAVCSRVPPTKLKEGGIIGCIEPLAAVEKKEEFPRPERKKHIFNNPEYALDVARDFLDDICPLVEGEKPPICGEFAAKQ